MSRTRILAAVLTAFLGLPPAFALAQEPAREEVHAIDARRRDALLSGDAATLATILADDFVEVGPNGGRSKATNVAELRSGRLNFTQATVSEEEVVVFDSTSAVVKGLFDSAGTAGGRPFQHHVRFLRVYLKRAGRWQNVAAANVPVAP